VPAQFLHLRRGAVLFVGDEVGLFEPVAEGFGGAATLAAALARRSVGLINDPVVHVRQLGIVLVHFGSPCPSSGCYLHEPMLGPVRDFVYFCVIKVVYGEKGMSHGKSGRGPRRRVVALADSIGGTAVRGGCLGE